MLTIVTDSSADLPLAIREEYNIQMLSMSIAFGDKIYKDQVDLTGDEFYRLLKQQKDIIPKTAYPTPEEMNELFSREVERGNQVLYICIASPLSGCYHAATLLAEEYPEGAVTVIDSRAATLSQGLLVLEAARLNKAGLLPEEIIAAVRRKSLLVHGCGVIDSLDYLQKGGRIGMAAAVVASTLQIKPIVKINEDGSISLWHKMRGLQKAQRWMVANIAEQYGRDFRDRIFCVGYTDDRALGEQLLALVQSEMLLSDVRLMQVGATIGAHLGPGLAGCFFLA